MRGHVRERGKGNWYAVLSIRDPQTGKRKVQWRSLPGCKGKREAQQECARIVTEMQSGGCLAPDKTTIAQFLERWLEHIKTQIGAASLQRYCEYVRNTIIPALGAVRLTKLRPEQISEMYSKALANGRHDGKEGGLSSRTVHHIHVVLKQALTQACVWRAIPYNPAALVRPPKVQRKEMKTLDTETTAKMIDAAHDTSLFISILLGVLCGLRRGEICALRWRSADLDNGQLAVVASRSQGGGKVIEKETKGGKGRLIALPAILVTELRRYRSQQAEQLLKLGIRLTDDHHIFAKEDGTPYWPGALSRNFKRFMEERQLPQIRLHDLRHSHASHLLAAGVHPKIAQERLGHSSIAMTMDTYSHAMPNMQADAVSKIDAALRLAMNKQDTNRQ
jgi:integrase